jgi:Ca-activated chloride channel family protein
MSLTWPWALAALLVVPMLLLARWWANRRRKRAALRVSNVALIRAALPGRSQWRRRVPVILFLTGLLALAAALTRPQAALTVPSNRSTIVLAIDVSGSMCATDVAPNRLTAATAAARAFVEDQDGETRIGLVAFSGIAALLVAPTTDQQALLTAIDTLTTARGTAIGQAILTAIDAVAEVNPDVAASGVDLGDATPGVTDYEPDTIVVLTDGANSRGVDPVTAAEQAAARRLRVFTIGFGTTQPSRLVCTAEQVGAGSPFRGDPQGLGGGGGRNPQIDEEALTRVADLTGGRYFPAEDAEQLSDVLADLPGEIGLRREQVEITAWFLLAGALLVVAGIGLSLWWNRAPGGATSPSRRPPPRPHP